MTDPHPQPKCQYSRTLEEVGDFCIIKDNWVGTNDCEKCPASHSSQQSERGSKGGEPG
jgi:hypothetical protein